MTVRPRLTHTHATGELKLSHSRDLGYPWPLKALSDAAWGSSELLLDFDLDDETGCVYLHAPGAGCIGYVTSLEIASAIRSGSEVRFTLRRITYPDGAWGHHRWNMPEAMVHFAVKNSGLKPPFKEDPSSAPNTLSPTEAAKVFARVLKSKKEASDA